MSEFLSTTPLTLWRGSCTLLPGAFETTPCCEHAELDWTALTGLLAPAAGVRQVPDKTLVRYVLPCILKAAPLVGKTLKSAQQDGRPTTGKQRSRSHLTVAHWVIFEFDGITPTQLYLIVKGLKSAGIASVIWTTWSFGLPHKPGVRVRLAFPVDRGLDADEYDNVWHGANLKFMLQLADRTGASLCQQQGTWATSPDRAHLARRWVIAGGVASVDALAAASPQKRKHQHHHAVEVAAPQELAAQIGAALGVVASVTPESVVRWAGMPSLVRDGEGRELAILRLAGKLQAVGIPEPQTLFLCNFYNRTSVVPPLDEDRVVDRATRYAETAVIWPGLFAMARDLAEGVVRNAAASAHWGGTRPAWTYLAAYHPKRWNQLWEKVEPQLAIARPED